VLPEYRGVDLKDVQVESNLFEGMTFSELLACLQGQHRLSEAHPVVASDPKSRTRDADKEQLLKL
jgi:DNA ligase 4